MLSNNRLSMITARDFTALSNLLTLALANNNISLVDPNIFGQNRSNPNLVIDMSGNPSVCETGWQLQLQSSVVYCFCAQGTVGQSLPNQQFASGCSSLTSLQIVPLPTVLVAGTTAVISTPLASKAAAHIVRTHPVAALTSPATTPLHLCSRTAHPPPVSWPLILLPQLYPLAKRCSATWLFSAE